MKRLLVAATLLLAFAVFPVLAQAQTAEVQDTLTVSTDAGNSSELIFGLDPEATDTIDAALGEQELPPPPPGFDVRFLDDSVPASGFGQGISKDYRNGSSAFTGQKQHQVSFQANSEATSVTIAWNLPSGVTGTIEDKFGSQYGPKTMTGKDSITVSPGAPDAIVTLDYTDGPSSEEVSFALADKDVVSGDTASVPVSVSGFSDVTTFQMSVEWDSTVTSFVSVDSLNLNGLDAGSFGTPDDASISDGKLTVSWDDPNAEGISVSDGTELFDLRLAAVGADGSSTAVSFSDSPTPREVTVGLETAGFLSTSGSVSLASTYSIAGAVTHFSGTSVGGVEVGLSGSSPAATSSDGSFSFTGILAGDYTLIPSYDSQDPDLGITTMDLLQMRRQILGLEDISSPEGTIAADVNGSESVTTLDIALTREVILGLSESVPAGFWRFVPEGHSFSDPPYSAPSFLELSVSGDLTGQNFTGVKRGDVNGSWGGGTNSASTNSETSGQRVRLGLSSETEEDTVTVSVVAEDVRNTAGLQFSLNWDPKEASYVETGTSDLPGFSSKEVSVDEKEGTFALAWTDAEAKSRSLKSGEDVVELKFVTKGPASVEFGGGPTPPRAYGGSPIGRLSVNLGEEISIGAPKEFASGKVYPNPTGNRATLEFSLPEKQKVRAEVFNILGQKVMTAYDEEAPAGRHSVQMNLSKVSSGAYFLRLQTENNQSRTQKITVVR